MVLLSYPYHLKIKLEVKGGEALKCIGIIKVDKIVKHKDRSATIYFSGITKELKKIIKEKYKAKRWNKKLFERFVIEGIENYLKNKEVRK